MDIKLTAEKSPQDYRDWLADNLLQWSDFPATLDYRPYLQPVRNQGNQGSCMAYAATTMKEYHELIDINFKGCFSPQFIYNCRKNQRSEGMYGRDLMKILTKFGVPYESTYEYNTIESKNDLLQKSDIIIEARNHRINGFAKVLTIDGAKKAINYNGPLIIIVPVYNYDKRIWEPESKDQTSNGGHAMSIVGYNETGFIIRNSWGVFWGDDGYSLYTYEDFKNELHWEIWTSIDSKSINLDRDELRKNEEIKEQERIKLEKLEQERLKLEKLEQERIKLERLKQNRLEKERLKQERIKLEKLEQNRLEKDRLDKIEIEREKREREKIERTNNTCGFNKKKSINNSKKDDNICYIL